MAGTTTEHNFISNNFIKFLQDCLRKKSCYLFSGQEKLYTPACEKALLTPDIHICCGDIKKEKLQRGAYALVNPNFIVEVLLRETKSYDRLKKFNCHRKILSFTGTGYLMIESNLEQQEPTLCFRYWQHDKEFTEKTYSVEAVGCLLKGNQVYNLPQVN